MPLHMRLNLPRFLLLLQLYFHISHTHFTFYCCTPVNLLKPSRSIIRGMRMRKPPLNNRNSSLFETLQYALPSLPSVVVPWHPRTPPHHLPPTLSVARSAAFATAALPQPASIHTLLPLAPHHIPCKASTHHLASYINCNAFTMLTPAIGRESEQTIRAYCCRKRW